MHGSIWSLVPFVIVIPIAILTRQVLPALVLGLLAGSYMLHPSIMGGLNATISYILQELAIPDNVRLIVFLYGFGAFVGLVRVSGGVHGFAIWMEKRIKSVKGAFAVTWISSLVTFMAPDFRIITVAPVMKHIFQRLGVTPSNVAYMIDLTSTPLTAIVPIGTAFVGYMVGLIATASRHHGIVGNPFQLLLMSIPFNFFSLLMLVYGLYRTFFRSKEASVALPGPLEIGESTRQITRQKVREVRHALLATEAGDELGVNREENGDEIPDALEVVSERNQPQVSNLVFPLMLLLVLTLFLTWWDGHQHAPGVLQALANADAAHAMLLALFITLLVSFVWYLIRKKSISEVMWGFLAGGNEMMGVNLLLVFVWAVSAVSTDLGFTNYTSRIIADIVPSGLIAPALFVFGCAISYIIGSSFGTWGLLLPLGFSLAAGTHASPALIIGAVFASGTFGGFASPLSDNTVAMATVMKLPLMDYARFKLKSALTVGGVCTVLYAAVGWFLPNVA